MGVSSSQWVFLWELRTSDSKDCPQEASDGNKTGLDYRSLKIHSGNFCFSMEIGSKNQRKM